MYMDSVGFPDATLFDHLNPWSDLRIVLDIVLPRILKSMKKEIGVSAIPPTISIRKKKGILTESCELEDAKIGNHYSPEAIGPRTSNILNGNVLATIHPETLVVGKVNEDVFQEFKTR
jgi:hypothetical protein